MLLALFLEELDRWAEALAAELGSRALQPEELAALLARTVAGQPRLAGLLARLAGVLERNLSLEGALAFKRALAGRAERIAGLLAEADPSLAGEPALRVVLALHGLVAGFWPMARPSAVVAEALERPDVRHLRVDFEPTLRDHLTAILHHVRGTGGAGAEETKGRSK
jgi:hypothetical protein